MRNWTHKVVKQYKDMQGEWTDCPAAKTGELEECERYAESFLAEQLAPTPMGNSLRGSMGFRIQVRQRGGLVVRTLKYA